MLARLDAIAWSALTSTRPLWVFPPWWTRPQPRQTYPETRTTFTPHGSQRRGWIHMNLHSSIARNVPISCLKPILTAELGQFIWHYWRHYWLAVKENCVYLVLQVNGVFEVNLWDLVLTGQTSQIEGKVKRAEEYGAGRVVSRRRTTTNLTGFLCLRWRLELLSIRSSWSLWLKTLGASTTW